jgi:hypothetical protein
LVYLGLSRVTLSRLDTADFFPFCFMCESGASSMRNIGAMVCT